MADWVLALLCLVCQASGLAVRCALIRRTFTGTPAYLSRVVDGQDALEYIPNGPKKDTPAEVGGKRTAKDLIESINPNVAIQPEVEDVRNCYSRCEYSMTIPRSYCWNFLTNLSTLSHTLLVGSRSIAVLTRWMSETSSFI